jgi:hypothetical protein
MQTPSATDPSFKAFLDKLQEQNSRGFVAQLIQLKADRENVGKDNDKREEQLDEVVDSLKEVRLAVTGISLDVDITPLVDIGENQTRLLEELSKESSLLRKLSEGSVEYDKEAAQYRNTSGKEIESVVSGKTSKKGGFLDFETARDTLSGQGKRVREDNKLAIKPIEYVPGKLTGKVTGVEKTKEDKDKIDDSVPDTRGFFATLIDELNAAPGRVRDYLIDHEEKSQANKDKESSITNNVIEKNKDNTVTNNVETVKVTKDNTVTNNVEKITKDNNVIEKNKDNTVTNNVEKNKDNTVTNNVERVTKDNTVTNNVERVTKDNNIVERNKDNTVTNNVERVTKDNNVETVESYVENNRTENVGSVFKTISEKIKTIPDTVREYLTNYKQENNTSRDSTVEKREIKVSSDREKPVSVDNPEADNIRDSQEIMADNSKSDLELSKQMLDTTREQLTVLQEIRDALTPKTPGELSGGNGPPSPGSKAAEAEEKPGGFNPLDLLDLIPGRRGKPGAKVPGKAPGGMSKLLKVGGAALAIGAGAYTAYQGYSAAEDTKQSKLEGVQAQLDAGQITTEQAAEQRKEIGNTATVEKSGAVGEGTGLAGGAIAGGIAGAKLGATIGTFFGPGIGTAIGAGVGGLAGGALGAFAGSSAGKYVGEAIGGGINTVKNFFGGSDVGEKTKEAVTGTAPTTDVQFNEAEFAKGDPQTYQKFVEFKDKRTTEISNEFAKKFGRDKPNQADVQVAQAKAKVEAIEKFKKEIEVSGAGKSIAKVEKSSGKTAEVDSKMVSGTATGTLPEEKGILSKAADTAKSVGSSVAGFFGFGDKKKTDTVDPNTKSGSTEAPATSTSTVAGAKRGDSGWNNTPAGATVVDEKGNRRQATLEEVNAVKDEQRKTAGNNYAAVVPRRVDSTNAAGATVAQTSTENADMSREAGKGGNNNTVVSNNVSNNETTKFMPSKPSPRPEFTGSALDRYLNKTAVY